MTTTIYTRGRIITDTAATINYSEEEFISSLKDFLEDEKVDTELKTIYRPAMTQGFADKIVMKIEAGKVYKPANILKQEGEVIRLIGIAGDVASATLVLEYLDRIGTDYVVNDYIDIVLNIVRTVNEDCYFQLVFATDTGAWFVDSHLEPRKIKKETNTSIIIGTGAMAVKGIDMEEFTRRSELNDVEGTYLEDRDVDTIKMLALADPMTNNIWREHCV